ncbi:MAG: D-aminoacyl-tRNA deacylase [Clostridia bacterium]|nr:D-aminoacyl-tRNA deacylase [Clostridia bacterium]
MKAVIQVVKKARLSVDGQLISEIGKGYVVFFGVGVGDDEEQADFIVKKISHPYG